MKVFIVFTMPSYEYADISYKRFDSELPLEIIPGNFISKGEEKSLPNKISLSSSRGGNSRINNPNTFWCFKSDNGLKISHYGMSTECFMISHGKFYVNAGKIPLHVIYYKGGQVEGSNTGLYRVENPNSSPQEYSEEIISSVSDIMSKYEYKKLFPSQSLKITHGTEILVPFRIPIYSHEAKDYVCITY